VSRAPANAADRRDAPDIEARVRAVMLEVTRHDTGSVSADDDLVEAFGIDSLEGLQILAGIEKRFGIRLPDDQLIHLRTIRRITETVDRIQREGRS
jgi:acyl carrier protein